MTLRSLSTIVFINWSVSHQFFLNKMQLYFITYIFNILTFMFIKFTIVNLTVDICERFSKYWLFVWKVMLRKQRHTQGSYNHSSTGLSKPNMPESPGSIKRLLFKWNLFFKTWGKITQIWIKWVTVHFNDKTLKTDNKHSKVYRVWLIVSEGPQVI